LRAAFEDGSSIRFAAIRGRQASLRTDYEPALQPLLVTSLGRSGTTWLMRLLAGHPSVGVYRAYPYESRAAAYWMHALRVLSQPANYDQSAHPDRFQDNLWWVGHHPSNLVAGGYPQVVQWLGRTYAEELAGAVQRFIDRFYGLVARAQDTPAPR